METQTPDARIFRFRSDRSARSTVHLEIIGIMKHSRAGFDEMEAGLPHFRDADDGQTLV